MRLLSRSAAAAADADDNDDDGQGQRGDTSPRTSLHWTALDSLGGPAVKPTGTLIGAAAAAAAASAECPT